MLRPDRTRRRDRHRLSLLGLSLAVAVLGSAAAGVPSVVAQERDGPVTGDDLFGGYALSARANGIQLTYDMPGFLPVSPIMQVSIPEADATLGTGPGGFARASLAFPGPLIADLGAAIALAEEDAPELPGYPVRAEAFYPAGPTEAEQGAAGGATMRASTTEVATMAMSRYTGIDADPIISVGSVTAASQSAVEDGQAVTRARTELTDVRFLGGVISIESVVTDLVATNDGHTGATDGGTTVQGVRVLGLAATLDERGLLLAQEPPPPTGLLGELGGDELGGVLGELGPVTEAVEQVTDPVNDALHEIFGQAVPQLNELLEAAGITITVLEPSESIGEGTAARTAGGVILDFVYRGHEQEALADLVNSLPAELRQSLGPLPNPVNLLVETHLMSLILAPASVSTVTSPLFEFEMPEFQPALPAPAAPPAPPTGTTELGDPGFATPLPDLPAPRQGQPPGEAVELASDPVALLSGAVPALLVMAALLGAALFGPASSRLADNVLAAGGPSCPQGLDRPAASPYPAPRE